MTGICYHSLNQTARAMLGLTWIIQLDVRLIIKKLGCKMLIVYGGEPEKNKIFLAPNAQCHSAERNERILPMQTAQSAQCMLWLLNA
jgi:hypothetical protein